MELIKGICLQEIPPCLIEYARRVGAARNVYGPTRCTRVTLASPERVVIAHLVSGARLTLVLLKHPLARCGEGCGAGMWGTRRASHAESKGPNQRGHRNQRGQGRAPFHCRVCQRGLRYLFFEKQITLTPFILRGDRKCHRRNESAAACWLN